MLQVHLGKWEILHFFGLLNILFERDCEVICEKCCVKMGCFETLQAIDN